MRAKKIKQAAQRFTNGAKKIEQAAQFPINGPKKLNNTVPYKWTKDT